MENVNKDEYTCSELLETDEIIWKFERASTSKKPLQP